MKIAVLGTRGIPNNYGGFEAFAEKLSVQLAERGHELFVFNSSLHAFKEDAYKGVKILTGYDPENVIGTAGQFIYDLDSIIQCRKLKPDIILQLGYTSSSIWSNFFPKDAFIITNMDGLEWKRSKYSLFTQKFLKKAERWAVRKSDCLVADNLGIQEYIFKRYNVHPHLIPYSAEIYPVPDKFHLNAFDLTAGTYNLVIARIEPENNIETIIRGHLANNAKHRLVIVGGIRNQYASKLRQNYASAQITFLDSIYDPGKLHLLRYYCTLYFHGHSVGGTNPSLLEAMSSSALICAHENMFNRSVLGNDALYFHNETDIAQHLDKNYEKQNFETAINNNLEKIRIEYNADRITDSYEKLFLQCLNGKNAKPKNP